MKVSRALPRLLDLFVTVTIVTDAVLTVDKESDQGSSDFRGCAVAGRQQRQRRTGTAPRPVYHA